MQTSSLFAAILLSVFVYEALAAPPKEFQVPRLKHVEPKPLLTGCQKKREEALSLKKRVLDNNDNKSSLPILIPECQGDKYAQKQCHLNSNFCQCWDEEGNPLTQPKNNLKECGCMIERSEKLKNAGYGSRPLADEIPLRNCEQDGYYTAKQCSGETCHCVDRVTGKKKSPDTKTPGLRCV